MREMREDNLECAGLAVRSCSYQVPIRNRAKNPSLIVSYNDSAQRRGKYLIDDFIQRSIGPNRGYVTKHDVASRARRIPVRAGKHLGGVPT